jgi:hypothetical protein
VYPGREVLCALMAVLGVSPSVSSTRFDIRIRSSITNRAAAPPQIRLNTPSESGSNLASPLPRMTLTTPPAVNINPRPHSRPNAMLCRKERFPSSSKENRIRRMVTPATEPTQLSGTDAFMTYRPANSTPANTAGLILWESRINTPDGTILPDQPRTLGRLGVSRGCER